MQDSRFKAYGLGSRVSVSGFMVEGSEIGVYDSVLRF
jgi:hypothetical protein